MKSYLVDFSGGVNQVVDKSAQETTYASVIDNGYILAGAIQPFRLPAYQTGLSTTTDVSLFEFRGKFYTSSNYRTYTADYLDSVDRIYYTEYGNSPRKIIEGVDVPLGTPAPRVSPTVAAGSGTKPSEVKLTQVSGGNYMKDQAVSYRVAFETVDGIQAPSAKVVTKFSTDSMSTKVTWTAPSAKIKPIKVLVFAGTEDKETKIAEVSPTETSYTDNGSSGSTGELASAYDQSYEYRYAYTFIRRVVGVENESAPSEMSYQFKSSAARSVTLDTANDGYWDSVNLVSYAASATEVPTTVQSASLGASKTLTAWAVDTADGRVKLTFSAAHEFIDGERIKFTGFTDTLWNNKVKAVRLISGSATTCYTDDTVAPTDGSVVAQAAARIVQVTLVTAEYDQYVQAIKFTTSAAHTFKSGDYLHFSGFADATWEGTEYEITVSNLSDTVFWVKGAGLPAGFTSGTATKLLTKVNISALTTTNAGFKNLNDNDLVYISDSGSGITGSYRARKIEGAWATAPVGFYIEKWTASAGTFAYATAVMRFIPHNDYIKYRRLYRVGDNAEWLKVTDLELWESTYLDAKSVDRLEGTVSSFYTENGVDVLYDVPPTGGEYIINHYGMKWLIDGHDVRWSPIGVSDAFPQVFVIRFPYRPVAQASFAQANCVLCEDAIYRIDGNTPTGMTVSKTLAEDGCIAPFSVQKTSAGLIYLSKRGLMAFDGQQSRCITDSKLLGKWLMSPAYSATANLTNFWWRPSSFNKLFQDMSVKDGLAMDPYAPVPTFNGTNPIVGAIRAIRSFVWQGKYFMYWAHGWADYAGHSMLCVDLQAEGFPITTLGFKPVDVCVSDMDEVYCLLSDFMPPDFTLSITVT